MADSPFSFSPTVTWCVRGVDGRRGQEPDALAKYKRTRDVLGLVAALGRSHARRGSRASRLRHPTRIILCVRAEGAEDVPENATAVDFGRGNAYAPPPGRNP